MRSTFLFEEAYMKEKKGIGMAIATIVESYGITPRRASRMIVYSDGTFSGTIGGGEAERNAIKDSISLIKEGRSELREYKVHNDGAIKVMIDVVSRKKSVYIFGSGHVSKALEEVFRFLSFEIHIVDAFYGEGEREFSLEMADENTALIFTDHNNRNLFLEEGKKSKAFYIGLLGSRSKRSENSDVLYSPSGLDILSDSPEETALSIAAEVVAALNKKRGISLKEERHRFIIVRGAGDLATGVIVRLKNAGYNVLAFESKNPSVIRRTVSLAEAVYEGWAEVEGVKAKLVKKNSEVFSAFDEGYVPIMVDEDAKAVKEMQPEVLIDAIIAKKNLGTKIDDAPLTIALGPGFIAGLDVNYVIETKRGHNLGRIIKEGEAEKNTGVPGIIEGFGKERVIHSPKAGIIKHKREIGDIVEKDEVILTVDGFEIKATISGMLRGLIRDGYLAKENLKIADIDPRGERADYLTISDKARSIAGSVLEVVDAYYINALSL